MTSSSEQTTALIAELRRAADKKRDDLALQSAALFTRAADALEVADRALTVDWAENITPEDESAIRRHMHELAVRNTALSAPRVVSTVAELDALPVGTVFRVKDGTTWEVMDNSEDEHDYRFESVHMKGRFEPKTFMYDLPATVLWVGGTE